MMNASIHARLPEKLAAAEAKEADQREAKGLETRYPKLYLVLFQSNKKCMCIINICVTLQFNT